MKFQRILPILALSLMSTSALAKAYVAQVEQLRGNVTQLKPGAREANPVFLGDQILEDTSIVTGEKSFVRLKFLDGTLLNLGPAGKVVVVQMKEQGAGVISLLKGTMRTQVEKSKNPKEGENKLFVRTRSAAMGVRGTDFQTIYNPENKATSLLTFKGEVAMTSFKEGAAQTELKKIRVNNEDIEIQEVVKKVDPKVEQKELAQALKSKNTVLVKPGQFSGTVQKLETVSKPVKISPVQLNALYKNQDLQVKSEEELAKEGSKNLKEETKKAIRENLVAQAEQEAPPEGFYNEKTKEFAPKSGGFLDLKTGLYVPPAADSEFDAQRKVYIPTKVGSVDNQTGEYKAPEGLKLDAKEGFVLDAVKVAELDETKKEEVSKNLVAMTQDLNKTIAKDLVLAPEKGVVEKRLAFSSYTSRELYTKNTLSLALTQTHNELEYSKTTNQQMNRKMKSSSGGGVQLSWMMPSDGVIQPFAEFTMKNVSYDEGGIRQKTERLFGLNLGARSYLNEKWNFVGSFSLEQNHYVTYTKESSSSTTTTPEFKPITVPKIRAGVNYALFESGRFQALTDAGLVLTLPRDSGDFSLKMGQGFYLGLAGKVQFSQKIWGQIGLNVQNEFQKASDKTISETIKRNESVVGFRVGGVF